jgi:CRP/FNR family transcriptional regulator, cyclic AMP receptor protein
MTQLDKIEALRASKLGVELTPDQCRVVADRIHFRDLADGEVLVGEGARDNHLYVLVSGALRVVRNAGQDDEVSLFSLAAGDLVGELSFIDGTEHYASLVARGPTRAFGIEREQLEALLKTDADAVYRIMRAIVRTVHQIQRRLSMQSVELSNYIYKQHGKY